MLVVTCAIAGCDNRAEEKHQPESTESATRSVVPNLREKDASNSSASDTPPPPPAASAGHSSVSTGARDAQNFAPPDPACVQQYEQAGVLAREGKFQEALPLLHAAAADPTVRSPALTMAGEILMSTGDSKTGEELLKAASRANPQNPRPYQLLSAWYYDIGAMDDALAQLTSLSEVAPDDPRPWRMRGLILKDFERHGEAIPAYQKALEIGLVKRAETEVRTELAECLLAARQPADAMQQLESIDESAQTLSLQAEGLFSLGEDAEAEKKVTKSLQLDPKNQKALMVLATWQRESGKVEKARETLEKAVEYYPYDFDFRFHLMTAYNALGEKEQALQQQKEMTRLRQLRTRFTELHHQAMQETESASVRLSLGKVAVELGRFQLAESWFRAALSLEPENADAKQQLEDLLSKTAVQAP